jgi:hypothetical protein
MMVLNSSYKLPKSLKVKVTKETEFNLLHDQRLSFNIIKKNETNSFKYMVKSFAIGINASS